MGVVPQLSWLTTVAQFIKSSDWRAPTARQTRHHPSKMLHVKPVITHQTHRRASNASLHAKHVIVRSAHFCMFLRVLHVPNVPLCVPCLTHYVRIWYVLFRVIQPLCANHCLTVTAATHIRAGQSTQSHDLPVQRNITCIQIHCM